MESLIAITIATVGLLGMFSLLSRSLSLTRVIADRYAAANLAGEGIEIVKNLIDNNILAARPWNQGLGTGSYEVEYDSGLLPYSGRKLFFNPTSGFYSHDTSGRETNFRREVRLERIGSDEIRVNSIVKWTSRGGGEFSIDLEDHFFNWQ
jgi:hypothetical protein